MLALTMQVSVWAYINYYLIVNRRSASLQTAFERVDDENGKALSSYVRCVLDEKPRVWAGGDPREEEKEGDTGNQREEMRVESLRTISGKINCAYLRAKAVCPAEDVGTRRGQAAAPCGGRQGGGCAV